MLFLKNLQQEMEYYKLPQDFIFSILLTISKKKMAAWIIINRLEKFNRNIFWRALAILFLYTLFSVTFSIYQSKYYGNDFVLFKNDYCIRIHAILNFNIILRRRVTQPESKQGFVINYLYILDQYLFSVWNICYFFLLLNCN